MPDHPCHMQSRGFLATGRNLVPTSCQELPPSPGHCCAPMAPMNVHSPTHVLEQDL